MSAAPLHPWPGILNNMFNVGWGLDVGTNGSRLSSTEHLKDNNDPQWYEFKPSWINFTLGQSNVNPIVYYTMDAYRDQLNNTSSFVNGNDNNFYAFSMGIWPRLTHISFTAIYSGANIAYDNNNWRTVSGTPQVTSNWKWYGAIGIQFAPGMEGFTSQPITGGGQSDYLAWSLYPTAGSNGNLSEITMQSRIVDRDYVKRNATSEPGEEFHAFTDGLFTDVMGSFAQNDQWQLTFYDKQNLKTHVFDKVKFYGVHRREVIVHTPFDLNTCEFDALCNYTDTCRVCVKWTP